MSHVTGLLSAPQGAPHTQRAPRRWRWRSRGNLT